MKFLVFIALACVSSYSFVSADLEEEALWMIRCANRTMSTGLPAAGIPVHLPKVEIENFTSSINLLNLGELHVALWNSSWAGLPWYDTPVVSGVSDGNTVSYNYSIYWPSFVLDGYFDWNITTSLFGQLAGQHATFSIDLTGVRWWGLFNMTLPKKSGNSYTLPHLNKITLESSAEKTKTSLSGLGLINAPVKAALQTGVDYLFNNFPETAGDFLRDSRFNGYWLNPKNPKPLLALLANCGINIPTFE